MSKARKRGKGEKAVIRPSDFKDVGSIVKFLNTAFETEDVAGTGNSERDSNDRAEVWSTGVMSIDRYLGCGGLVGGRIVNAFGWEGAGKTLAGLVMAAAVQRSGGRAAVLDAEGTLSPSMCRSVGIDLDSLILVQSTPEKILSGEDYFDAARLLAQMGVEFILLDSMPALVPSSRLEARIGEGQKATQQIMYSEGLSAINAVLNAHKRTVLYLINQMRGKPMQMFGPSEGSTGGNAIRFYSTYGLSIRKEEDVIRKVLLPSGRYEDRRIGARCTLRATKNKVSPIPPDPVEYTIYFGDYVDANGVEYKTGIDVIDDAVTTGISAHVIESSGSWYSWGGIKAQGKDAFREELRRVVQEDYSVFEKLRNEVVLGAVETS